VERMQRKHGKDEEKPKNQTQRRIKGAQNGHFVYFSVGY